MGGKEGEEAQRGPSGTGSPGVTPPRSPVVRGVAGTDRRVTRPESLYMGDGLPRTKLVGVHMHCTCTISSELLHSQCMESEQQWVYGAMLHENLSMQAHVYVYNLCPPELW